PPPHISPRHSDARDICQNPTAPAGAGVRVEGGEGKNKGAGTGDEVPASAGTTRQALAITGAANADAVSGADVVLLAVPFEGLHPTAESLREALAGRLVVSIVAPVEFVDGQMRAVSVPEGSAGELTRDLLPESRVAAAFQNMSARDLLRADHPLEGDVAVTADDDEARRETMALAEAMPSLRAVDAGPLSNSRYVEELTALLVNLNRIHKAHSTIRFLGL
ncbi:MAG: hypothetical protein F4X54_03580, partial [Chloroflexi bacterium]|nr:hypothetical protein [Chloroflexota bacterium]